MRKYYVGTAILLVIAFLFAINFYLKYQENEIGSISLIFDSFENFNPIENKEHEFGYLSEYKKITIKNYNKSYYLSNRQALNGLKGRIEPYDLTMNFLIDNEKTSYKDVANDFLITNDFWYKDNLFKVLLNMKNAGKKDVFLEYFTNLINKKHGLNTQEGMMLIYLADYCTNTNNKRDIRKIKYIINSIKKYKENLKHFGYDANKYLKCAENILKKYKNKNQPIENEKIIPEILKFSKLDESYSIINFSIEEIKISQSFFWFLKKEKIIELMEYHIDNEDTNYQIIFVKDKYRVYFYYLWSAKERMAGAGSVGILEKIGSDYCVTFWLNVVQV
jgi:hypothetical protein